MWWLLDLPKCRNTKCHFIFLSWYLFYFKLNDSYLRKFVINESVNQCGFSDFGISDEDDITVVASLGQSVSDTSHFVYFSFLNSWFFLNHENTLFYSFDFVTEKMMTSFQLENLFSTELIWKDNKAQPPRSSVNALPFPSRLTSTFTHTLFC